MHKIRKTYASTLLHNGVNLSIVKDMLGHADESTTLKHYIYNIEDGTETEDSLLLAMERAGAEDMDDDVERKGLGTPVARAEVIEKLVKDGFVKREKKQMIPTEDGVKLIAVLPDVVKSPKLTSDWGKCPDTRCEGRIFHAGIYRWDCRPGKRACADLPQRQR